MTTHFPSVGAQPTSRYRGETGAKKAPKLRSGRFTSMPPRAKKDVKPAEPAPKEDAEPKAAAAAAPGPAKQRGRPAKGASGDAKKEAKAAKPKKVPAGKKAKKAAVKPIKKAAKKAATSTKPKAVRKVKKATKKKSAESGGLDKYEKWVVEAIASLKTDDHTYVSLRKIRQYLLDYYEGQPFRIPKLAKKAALKLLARKVVKAKKDSYQFTVHGASLVPEKIEKRKKIIRPESKAPPKKVKEEPAKSPVIVSTGRVSKPPGA